MTAVITAKFPLLRFLLPAACWRYPLVTITRNNKCLAISIKLQVRYNFHNIAAFNQTSAPPPRLRDAPSGSCCNNGFLPRM